MNNVVALNTDFMRQAPANIDAECALLGTLMLRNATFDKVSDYLKPEHFADATNARLYEIISQHIATGQRADPVTLKAHAASDGFLSAAGGPAYLASLVANVPTTINADNYGRIIYDLFLRREIIGLATQAASSAYDTSDPATRQIEELEEHLFALAETRSASAFVSIGDAAKSAIAQIEIAHKANGAVIGVPTGLTDLDRQLGGLHPSDLSIIAGRPSMGKSGLALTIAFNAAKAGKRVALFSLEMSASQMANRALAHFANMDSHGMRNGRIGGADFAKLADRQQMFAQLPLMVEDAAGQTVMQMRTACRRLKRKGLDLVIIDYLQLIAPSGKGNNRVEEVSAITWGLKCMAKDLNVPVVALSQLSRQVESREDKRPMLSDLRESGSIEQDADVVMFVYRDEYYLERANKPVPPEVENTAEVIVAKQRHGPIGMVACRFDHKSAWFENLARHHGAY